MPPTLITAEQNGALFFLTGYSIFPGSCRFRSGIYQRILHCSIHPTGTTSMEYRHSPFLRSHGEVRLSTISALPLSSIKNILYGKSQNPKLLTIKIICDGLEITLGEFFNTPEFDALEQEIK